MKNQTENYLLSTSLRTFRTVLGTALHTLSNTLSIKSTTDDVITYTRQVLNTTATDQNNAVLLKVVTDAGDVGTDFDTVRKSYSGDFSQR